MEFNTRTVPRLFVVIDEKEMRSSGRLAFFFEDVEVMVRIKI